MADMSWSVSLEILLIALVQLRFISSMLQIRTSKSRTTLALNEGVFSLRSEIGMGK